MEHEEFLWRLSAALKVSLSMIVLRHSVLPIRLTEASVGFLNE